MNDASIDTFNGYDYPDINAQQVFVYSDGMAFDGRIATDIGG